ncbi:MAG: ZPR1 zinc finger domain-containing protein [Candidatus Thermoplasmatota archaeon]
MPHATIEEATCPSCDGKGLEYTTEPVELPFMGTSLEIMLRCERCGYRHTDFVLTEHREPTRYSYVVKTGDDMMVRVVRSSSGTVRIPELGITIEPGAASEAFVSNIEGVMVRVERILTQLMRDAEDEAMRDRIRDLQDTFAMMRDGKAPPVTLIIEDPFGNSAILGEGAMHEPIPPEQAEQLKVGMLVYDPDGNPVDG